jgi:DNA-binding NarL/FixJ family response regulator
LVSPGPESIRILAVDDHAVLRGGIAALLATQSDMSLVAEASNGREAIDQFRIHKPDITLMDLQMPEMNGLDATIAIRGEFPEARIVVLTTFISDKEVQQAFEAGARAYLLKSMPPRKMLEVIRQVHAGEKGLLPR